MIAFRNKYLDDNAYKKYNFIKRLNLYFILVTTFSCLMFFFIIIQLINAQVIYSISPHKEDAAVSQSLLNYSVTFSFLSIFFFILILIFLISSYVFMLMGINRISQVDKKDEYDQKEFEKIKKFAILSMFTLGLVFPWIIIHKFKKLKNK